MFKCVYNIDGNCLEQAYKNDKSKWAQFGAKQ